MGSPKERRRKLYSNNEKQEKQQTISKVSKRLPVPSPIVIEESYPSSVDLAICSLESGTLSPTNSLSTIDMDNVSCHSNASSHRSCSQRSQSGIPKFDHREDIESDAELMMNLEEELKR